MRSTDDRMRALLQAARGEDPPASAKRRVRAAVLAQVAAGALQGGSQGGSPARGPGAESAGPGASSGAPGPGAAPGPAGAAISAGKPAIMVSLGKAVIAAVLTGAVGFAAGVSVDRGAQGAAGAPSATGRETAVIAGAGAPSASESSGVVVTPPVASSGTGSTAARQANEGVAGAPSASTAAPHTNVAVAAGAPGSSGRKGTSAPPRKDGVGRRAEAADGGARDSALSAELALLREVQDALRDGDATRAESWLGEHERRYPEGVLREEREAARVISLCLQGRRAEAKAAAEKFLAANPRSVQSARVRASCAFAEDAGAP